MEDYIVEIYIDGSALTNPGAFVGCAGIIKYPESSNSPDKELRWSYSMGTSGNMELLALVNALKWVNKNAESLVKKGITDIHILSDSAYVVEGATRQVYYWSNSFSKNKWKKADGGSVKHQRVWKDFLRERKKLQFNLNIEWIEGKSTQETRDVDKVAKKAAKGIVKKPNFDYVPLKIGRSLLGKGSKLELLSDIGQTHLIRVCAHGSINRKKDSEHEVRFEIIKSDHIEGRFKAFTSQKTGFRNIDRGHYYYATVDDNEDLPWITEIKEINGAELEAIKKRVESIRKK